MAKGIVFIAMLFGLLYLLRICHWYVMRAKDEGESPLLYHVLGVICCMNLINFVRVPFT